MRYDNPELQDHLASQYALGTLTRLTRRRVEALMQDRPDLEARVAVWQEKLAPLADTAPPTVPPAHVLNALHRRLFHGTRTRQRPTWWDQAAFWRWMAGAAFAGAAALAAFVVVDIGFPEQPATIAERHLAPNYVAVLSDDAAKPALVVSAFDKPWRLAIEPLEGLSIPEGSALRIWAVERETGTIRPLARVDDQAPVQLAMSDAMWSMVQNAESLVVSLDRPDADAPGRTLYAGLCIRLNGPPGMRSGSAADPKWPEN